VLFRRNYRQKLVKLILKLLRLIWRIFYTSTQQIITKLKEFISYLGQSILSIIVLVFLILSVGIVCAGILPSPQVFEGSLVVKNVSFTYSGRENNKLFLNNIQGISQIEGEGTQNIILNGNFSSPTDTTLNEKLLKRNSLKIQLPYEKSQWILSSSTNNLTNKLRILELRLQPNTFINKLNYKPYNRRLLLSLDAKEENDIKIKIDKVVTAGQLLVNLGFDPIKLNFTGYLIEELGLKDSPEEPIPIELIFKPNNPQLNLYLSKPTHLSINLPDPNKVNSEDWLWGDITVQNVRFEASKQTGINVNDEIYKSTIIKGQIRMGEKELKIESNQFLLISKPGINRLLNLEVIPPKPPQEINVQITGEDVEISTPPEGLEVRVVGEAEQIQAGLDSRLPVRSLRSTFLANFFSNDVVIAMVSFFSATFISLLTWIVNDFLSWLSANSRSTTNP
jgi:hypothetical protein